MGADGKPAITRATASARGRGRIPRGTVVAKDVAELHGANGLTKQTALSEKGEIINGRGDTPNRHGCADGLASLTAPRLPAGEDRTCKNWTSSTQGAAMLGHISIASACATTTPQSPGIPRIRRDGPDGGCSQTNVKTTGGDGLMYCFAAN